jgi:hypothetical protein
LPKGTGMELPGHQCGHAADQGPAQVQGIRHQRKAVRGRQGRQRHLRHGHHDGARRQGPGCAEPQDQKQDGVVKDGQEVSQVIMQEGVLTNERMNDAVAEPVVYMMDRYVVGGFYRMHAERGVTRTSARPGSSFVPLAFAESTHLPQPGMKPGRQCAQPLLHVRRDRPAGHAGRQLRAGSHRPRRRNPTTEPPARRGPVAAAQQIRPEGTLAGVARGNKCSRGAQSAVPSYETRRPRPATRGACVSASKSSLAALTLGAIGVVYGDIGTSVLYARQGSLRLRPRAVHPANVYGILSIFFWTLTSSSRSSTWCWCCAPTTTAKAA